MMGFLTRTLQEKTVVAAALPLAAVLVGCTPSVTPLGGVSRSEAAEISMPHDSVTHDVRARPGDRPSPRIEPIRARPAQPPVALTAARKSEYRVKNDHRLKNDHSLRRLFTLPKKEKTMTTAEKKPTMAGKVEHVGTDRFQQHVLQADVPVLVDFYADWCGPCRMLAPVLDQVARETPHAKVVKVNIDTSPQLAQAYGVSSIPTVMVFKEGSVVAQHTGLADRGTIQRLLAR